MINLKDVDPENRAKTKGNKNHRKEAEEKSISTLTDEQWEYCKKFFDYSCAYCGKKVSVLCRDHFAPLSLGGTLSVGNIVPCCSSCNSSKSNRKFSQWYKGTPFYSYKRQKIILDYLNSMKDS